MECLPKLCEICDEHDRVYKCPRCGMGTCSLKCCVQHKQNTGCDGKRDKTAFVSVKAFNESHMKSDYHFLEDVLQTRQSAKRTFEVDCGGEQRSNFDSSNKRQKKDCDQARTILPVQPLKNYNNGAKVLVKQAKDRGISVLLQPQGMSKRMENTSRFEKRNKSIIWQLTIVFVLRDSFLMSELLSYDASLRKVQSSQCDTIGFYVKDVPESISMNELLKQIFSTLPWGSLLAHLLRSFKGDSNLNLLIRKMPSPANDPLFSKINNNETLREGLSGHQLIEFPTIYVCKSASLARFRLMINDAQSTNAEETKAASSSRAVVDNVSSSPFLKTEENEASDSITEIDTSVPEESADIQDVKLEISLIHTIMDAKEEEIIPTNVEENKKDKEKTTEINEEEEEDVVDNEECDPLVAYEDEDVDEGYEEFMNNLMDLQGKDIKTLQSIIQNE